MSLKCLRFTLWDAWSRRWPPFTSCPAVFQSVQEIDDFCGELSATLDRWIDTPPQAAL